MSDLNDPENVGSPDDEATNHPIPNRSQCQFLQPVSTLHGLARVCSKPVCRCEEERRQMLDASCATNRLHGPKLRFDPEGFGLVHITFPGYQNPDTSK